MRKSIIAVAILSLTGCASLKPILPPWLGGYPDLEEPEITSFLDIAGSSHPFFSDAYSDSKRHGILNALEAQGCNAFYFYAANDRDYGGKSVRYDGGKKDKWVEWLRDARSRGMKRICWLRADDSPTLNRWNMDQWRNYIDLVVRDLDDEIEEYVVGLELNEYWSKGVSDAVGSYLNSKTDKPIGVHQTPGRVDYCHSSWCDVMYYQYGFGKSAAQLKSDTRRYAAAVGGRRFIGSEYANPSGTASAKGLGDAILSTGVTKGVGNSANRKMTASVDSTPEPVLEPVPVKIDGIRYAVQGERTELLDETPSGCCE